MNPLVTVVCLCYNQARWVEEAVLSVVHQTYPNIQLIVADDASTDGSAERIRELHRMYPSLEVILNNENMGNCKAFNRAFQQARGEYVIDFAADDVMMPDRIEKQVRFLQQLDASYGVVFTDAVYIDAEGKFIRNHYAHLLAKGLLKQIPEGDVYKALLKTYFISSPSMMMRRHVLVDLNGYDENLAYEDFDFWIRSARSYRYAYLNETLTKVRRTRGSMSTTAYHPGDRKLLSTYRVCEKALSMNREPDEDEALAVRVRYELKHSVFSDNYAEASLFFGLLQRMGRVRFVDMLIDWLGRRHLPLRILRRVYLCVKK